MCTITEATVRICLILPVILRTSDVAGVHATGRKAADGRDVYHIHVISAAK